jgi:hypothetical protein
MTIAFVLGNGVSRQGLPLHNLAELGRVYGCNGLYRDFTPYALIATDKPIAAQIQNSGYSLKNKFYTRRPFDGQGALNVPKPYFGFSSGPLATGIAALDKNHRVYMIGFDMGPNKNQKFNNVYADSEFYKKSDAPPTYTGNWVKQICQVAKEFPNTEFVRVCGATTATIPELEALKNFEHLPINSFIDRINNQKDL